LAAAASSPLVLPGPGDNPSSSHAEQSMEAADYEVLSVREQLFHERVRECIVSAGSGQEGDPGGRGTGVGKEGEKFGSECDHLGPERCCPCLNLGLAMKALGWRERPMPGWLTPRSDPLGPCAVNKARRFPFLLCTPLPQPPPVPFLRGRSRPWVFKFYKLRGMDLIRGGLVCGSPS
jgi:hypothetical protein